MSENCSFVVKSLFTLLNSLSLSLFFPRSLFLSKVSAFRCEKERTKDMEDEEKESKRSPCPILTLRAQVSSILSVFYLPFPLLHGLK
uniref:Uncharacterized protein n=2 Tax=Cyprinus carpio TaxID=7962 RepID=A0A9J7ZVF5_CYPCA